MTEKNQKNPKLSAYAKSRPRAAGGRFAGDGKPNMPRTQESWEFWLTRHRIATEELESIYSALSGTDYDPSILENDGQPRSLVDCINRLVTDHNNALIKAQQVTEQAAKDAEELMVTREALRETKCRLDDTRDLAGNYAGKLTASHVTLTSHKVVLSVVCLLLVFSLVTNAVQWAGGLRRPAHSGEVAR
jgi:hypothetical protein